MMAAWACAAEQAFDWRAVIDADSQAAALKRIYPSEIDPRIANQHEFHGIIPFRAMLGDARLTLRARFVYASDDDAVFSASFVTWYDSCSGTTRCDDHWRIYYPKTYAMSRARPGDTLLVARMHDESLILVMAPPDSVADRWMRRYGGDTRLKGLAPPDPAISAERRLPQSPGLAKTLLRGTVHGSADARRTLYCGCDYDEKGRIDALSCGYEPARAGSPRSARVEWEHIVPAAVLGRGRSCWSEGHADCVTRTGNAYRGRRCCTKVDADFRAAVSDPRNLAPVIGELNADRADLPHGELAGEPRRYGACDFEVSRKLDIAEPPAHVRGLIGRTWLLMAHRYGLDLAEDEVAVYEAWTRAYPPNAWELLRQNQIQARALRDQ